MQRCNIAVCVVERFGSDLLRITELADSCICSVPIPAPNVHALAQRRAWQVNRLEQEAILSHRNAGFSLPLPRPIPTSDIDTLSRSPPSQARQFADYLAARHSDDRPALDSMSPQRRSRMVASSSSSRRRHTQGSWSSEEDSAAEERTTEDSYRRSADLLFSHEDEERTMAAMRGAITLRKKTPSKAAIASLITMTIAEVKAEGEDLSKYSVYRCGKHF